MDRSEKLLQYLYGELSGGNRDAIEERVFADDELASELDDLEIDLVDSFVRGEMSAEEDRHFKERYLTSKSRLARVNLAKYLNESTTGGSATAPPESVGWLEGIKAFFGDRGLVYAGLAAAVIIAIGGFWFLSTLPDEEVAFDVPANSNEFVPPLHDDSTDESSAERNGDGAGGAAKGAKTNVNSESKRNGNTQAVPEAPRTFAFTLLPPVRSSGRPVLEIPKGTDTVRITIVHDNRIPFAKYKAILKDNTGAALLTRDVNLTDERPVSISVRANRLKAGSYELTLVGLPRDGTAEEIGFYGFSVRVR
jgi:hypothetical protein